jgi:hypothetical protein
MPSKLKSDTARINGAKSHGPVTPEGRAKSAANSRTHGLAAKYLLLPNESNEHFELFRDDYLEQFQPQTGVEADLVEVMVIARWRLRLFLSIESHLFDTEIARRQKQIDAKFNDMDQDARLAWVFQHMADNGQSIALLIRYEGSINRSYEKALKQLLLLQSRRPTPPPSGPWVRSAFSHSPDPAAPEPRPEPRPKGAVTSPDSPILQPSELRPSGSGAHATDPATKLRPAPRDRRACSMLRPSIPFAGLRLQFSRAPGRREPEL